MPVLQVAPDGFRVAASLLGDGVGGLLQLAWVEAGWAWENCGAMGGSDHAGTAWSAGYDAAAAAARSATTDFVNACYTTAALLDQTGINYGEAEQSSTDGAPPPGRERARFRGRATQSLSAVPSAIGSVGVAPPPGWSTLAGLVGDVWPDGHQDTLRSAAAAWQRLSTQAGNLQSELIDAMSAALEQVCPEINDMSTVLSSLLSSLSSLADSYASIGQSCDDYAHHLDQAHHALIAEIESFVAWTITIESASAFCTFLSAGLSEIVGNIAEAKYVAAVVRTIKDLLETLRLAAIETAATVLIYTGRLEQVSDVVSPMLARETTAADLRAVSETGAIPEGRELVTQIPTADQLTPACQAISRLDAEAADGASGTAYPSKADAEHESIGPTTDHGRERIAGPEATRGGVLSAKRIVQVRKDGALWRQADGATVRVLEDGDGKADVVIDGSRGLITTFSRLSGKSFTRLVKRYGWTR